MSALDLAAIRARAEQATAEPEPDGPCAVCGDTFAIDDGLDPSACCHTCAQSLLAKLGSACAPLCDALEAAERELARLRAEVSDEGGAAAVLIEIRGILGLAQGESTIDTVKGLRALFEGFTADAHAEVERLTAENARLCAAQVRLLRIIGDAAKALPEAAEGMLALADMAIDKAGGAP